MPPEDGGGAVMILSPVRGGQRVVVADDLAHAAGLVCDEVRYEEHRQRARGGLVVGGEFELQAATRPQHRPEHARRLLAVVWEWACRLVGRGWWRR